MDMRKVAKSLPAELDTAAHWIESCPFENAIPHAERLRKRSEDIRAALAQPDMLAEAVELLRRFDQARRTYVYPDTRYSEFACAFEALADDANDFLRRYYAAQQEQNK